MAIEKQETQVSQTDLTKQLSSQTDDELYFLPQTFDSLRSPSSSTDAIIIIDDEEDETLDPKNKKRDEKIDSPTFKSLGSLPSTDARIIINDEEKETLERKKKNPRLGSWWDKVEDFNELSSVVKGLPKAKDDNDAESRGVDSCFSSTDVHEKKREKKKDDERSLSSSHHDNNFIDLSKDDRVDESTSTSSSNKGNEHVSLEKLGISVEDLKSMPWEAFDPTWEIRSETMDPWLGGYVKDMQSPHH